MAIVKRLEKGTELTHIELDGNFTHLDENKVEKVTGKQLSTEDYTTTEKTKLLGIEAGANFYVHPTTDGSLHVTATGTTNNGKVLTAGATAGSFSWQSIPAAPVTSVAGKTGIVTLLKGDVGLGNVDNTSDLAKPISTATQTALNSKEATFTKNTAFNKNFGTVLGTVLQGDWRPTWTEITGKPTTFTPSAHTHAAADITSGIFALARIPTGTTAGTVAEGNHTHDSRYYTETELDSTTGKLDKQTNIQAFWNGTQAQYDAIATKSTTTIYFIE